MEQFYALASEDYRQLALAHDWAAWLKAKESALQGAEARLRLLDVACGSGKFPSALLKYAGIADAGLRPIDYDLLDPSAFSLSEARAVLEPPFEAGAGFESRLQDFSESAGRYDIAWATHALYAIPESELVPALACMLDALAPDGIGFIAHASADSHYLNFYRLYLDHVKGGAGTPYSSAEEVLSALAQVGASTTANEIRYQASLPVDRNEEVEGYLQRCLFDDALTLADMRAVPAVGRYLDSVLTDGVWRFPQAVQMIFFRRA
jgi:Methylase involved in ubiquinone/menaquinone biosynthesis